MQLTFENITITTIPKKGRCGKPSTEKPKEILKSVSGTIEPGQFLSIIGASGKNRFLLITCILRCWKDNST